MARRQQVDRRRQYRHGDRSERCLQRTLGADRVSMGWAFTPEQTTYVQETQPLAPPLALDASPEVFMFTGVRAKLRVYNAFLQGQFRHSDLTYAEGDVNKTLVEVWAGVEWRSSSGWALQYLARWESPELRGGSGSFTWGSIEISKLFR